MPRLAALLGGEAHVTKSPCRDVLSGFPAPNGGSLGCLNGSSLHAYRRCIARLPSRSCSVPGGCGSSALWLLIARTGPFTATATPLPAITVGRDADVAAASALEAAYDATLGAGSAV